MAKIILNVELNSDKVPSGIKKIRSEIASLGQEFGKIKNAKDVTDGVKALTTHYEKLAKAANEVVKVYKKQTDEEAKLKSKYLDLEKQYADFIKTTQKAGEQNKDFANGMKNVLKSIEDVHARLREYNKGETDVVDSTEDLVLMLKEAKKESASLGMEYRNLTKSLKDGADAEKAIADKQFADIQHQRKEDERLRQEAITERVRQETEAAEKIEYARKEDERLRQESVAERIRQENEVIEKIAYARKEEQRLNEETANEKKRQETEKAEAIKKTREEEDRLLQEHLEAQKKLKESYEQAWESFDKVFGNAAIRLWRTWFSEVKNILDDTNEVLIRTENTVIELQRVLNDNVSDRQISNALYQLAQQYGQTFENASIIAENFAKSGMSWNDTIKATESALLAMNVAELNASESSEGLLSIMVQFKKDASELETIVDQLNKTADKNPVTTEKLLKALQRTGSAAATSNLSLEKTIGIITTLSAATNRSGQNIGTATNALIMYTQKNLDTFAAMSEESAKVVENFKRGTADVVDIWRAAQDEIEKLKKERGDLVSLTDLFGGTEGMEELNASLHDELDDVFEQISSVYDIANTYRKNYFIALLDNLDRFDKVQQQLQDAQGYSQEENLKYMETFEAKQNTLIAKWQYLANDEQGLLKFRKGMLDIGGVILDVIKHTGGISNAILTISGQVGGLLLMVKSASIVKKLREAKDAMVAFGKAVKGVADEGKAAEASFGWVGVAVAAISLVAGVINGINTSIDNARQATLDAADASRANGLELDKQFKKLNTLDEKTDEYYDVEQKIVSLLGDKAKELEGLTQGTDAYTEAVKRLTKQEIADEIQRQKAALAVSNPLKTNEKIRANKTIFLPIYGDLLDAEQVERATNHAIEIYKQYKERLDALSVAMADAKNAGAMDTYAGLQADYDETNEKIKDVTESFEKYIAIQDTIKQLEGTYSEIVENEAGQLQNLAKTVESSTLPALNKLASSLNGIIEKSTATKEGIDLIAQAQKEYDEEGAISTETLQKIIELGGEYAEVIEVQNGKFVVNKTKLDELLKSKKEYLNDLINEEVLAYAQSRANEILVESQNDIAIASANAATGMGLLIDTFTDGSDEATDLASKYKSLAANIMDIANSTGLSASDTKRLMDDVYEYRNQLKAALSDWYWSPSGGGDGDGGGGGGGGSTIDEYYESLKGIISLRKSELTLMEHQGKSAEEQIEKMKDIQKVLHTQAEYMRKVNELSGEQVYTLEQINNVSSEWWTYQEKILKTYQETLNAAKELELEAIEKVISSIQEEIDLKEEELTLSEKQLAVTQAQADLEKAIAQAKLDFISQVLSNYITALADAETLEEKQRAVVEAKEKYATAQKEAQTKAIVDAMKAQKDLGKDALSLEEKRLAVEEARQALIDAQNDRTTRVFDEASGEWHYEANAQNIKSAQERLADAMKSLDDYLEGEAWDEMLDKMEKGSVSESEMLAIIQKWQDQGYGTTEWSEKLVQAYRFAMGATADPNSVAGELNAVNSATKSLNDYLKNQAIKEIQNMIKNGNTSTAEMQLIMEKWLSMGEGGEIWQWSEGVLNEVRKAIQSNAYDGSKVESSVKAVETATKALADYFQNKFVSDINKLVAAGSAAEIYAALKYWEETGQIPDDLMDWGKRLADEVGIKNKVENDYKSIENDPSHYGEVKSVVDSGYAASMTSAALAATNPDLTSALTGVAQFGANAASWMNSYGIGYGASDKTPSESFINTRNSTTNDSHNSYTVNGVPFSADSIRGLTMQELFETLPIVTE